MPSNIDDSFTGLKRDVSLAYPPDYKHHLEQEIHSIEPAQHPIGVRALQTEYLSNDLPTAEETATLRRVSEKIPWRVYTIAFVELCERFSYYGATVVYTDFIQQPLVGPTGAGIYDPDQTVKQSGALGMGQRAANGLVTFNQFWVYLVPLFASYLADTYWGRYKTIFIATAVAIAGHLILVASAAPGVLAHTQGATAAFVVGLVILGLGTGSFKPNVSPLVAEQIATSKMRVEILQSGERVIIDPAVTISRIYNWFYLLINVGSLIGQIAMAFCELYVGFWLSFLLPTCLFLICPIVLVTFRKQYVLTPPQGSVLGPALRLFFYAQKGRWSLSPINTFRKLNDGTLWDSVKPSRIPPSERPAWMIFDDAWVDEVRRGFKACAVFCWFPLYWLGYNQTTSNLVSQAAAMTRNGLPGPIVSNLDPLALIILIPICDLFIYPTLRKAGFRITPVKKITWGFISSGLAMIWAMVVQIYIYRTSPCGTHASKQNCMAPLNIWIQSGSYILTAIGEILASITSLEYAFSKAPKNMRSLVMSLALFTTGLSAAIAEAFVALSEDPLLVWNYGVFAVISLVAGVLFWFAHRSLDEEEDALNSLPTGHLGTKEQAAEIERRMSTIPKKLTATQINSICADQ